MKRALTMRHGRRLLARALPVIVATLFCSTGYAQGATDLAGTWMLSQVQSWGCNIADEEPYKLTVDGDYSRLTRLGMSNPATPVEFEGIAEEPRITGNAVVDNSFWDGGYCASSKLRGELAPSRRMLLLRFNWLQVTGLVGTRPTGWVEVPATCAFRKVD